VIIDSIVKIGAHIEEIDMRAYQISDQPGLDCIGMTERPTPLPGLNQAVVAVKAVSLNYRDLVVAKGAHADGAKPVGIIPASDAAGEVVAVGDGVTRAKIGDRVVAAFMPGWVDGELTAEKQATSLGGGSVDGVLAE
jgi:NADPH:quinone reductase-like Zn-dependent oxidoreductase